ncbi:hypothetical protein ASPZODRAFT_144248 [Penicilliopsis zonata CBS 506.65]|uniref:HNH nuclease domain-containing protein n=1 Tax=Penicilliopsis zonata CBS 506.65 TaxID=1073090 RepID=A0A1L9SCR0_9EURO|nr:hypothetical protein ASPZODRAFT_144248 [Penicilliopsis zonata CBS 506.65]OJJ44922.1 hypothetical protein ASPZODRAFT_144248 [Penicilliopsis zonata CBS 506.65]
MSEEFEDAGRISLIQELSEYIDDRAVKLANNDPIGFQAAMKGHDSVGVILTWLERKKIQKAAEARFALAKQNCYDRDRNEFCLAPTVHRYWGKARFALKPIEASEDGRSLNIQFYWLPIRNLGPRVNLLVRPSISGPVSAAGDKVTFFNLETDRRVRSDDLITLTSSHPDSHPLPSVPLLEMQWYLQRIAALSGASEEDDEDYSDDDEDDGDTVPIWEEEET